MSIVYDYLKQIKESKEPAKEKEAPKAAPAASPSSGSKFRSSIVIKILVVLLLCLAVGVAVYFLAPRAVKPIVKLYHPPAAAKNVAGTQSSDPSYVLEGIIYNPSQPFAIINGKMLEAKNMIGDYEVVKITPDSVMLLDSRDQTTRTIHL